MCLFTKQYFGVIILSGLTHSNENTLIIYRFQNLERDYNRAQEEIGQLRSAIERLRLDKSELEEQLNEVNIKYTLN